MIKQPSLAHIVAQHIEKQYGFIFCSTLDI